MTKRETEHYRQCLNFLQRLAEHNFCPIDTVDRKGRTVKGGRSYLVRMSAAQRGDLKRLAKGRCN
jgi:hypothetical protein